ncbi:MAG: hypothetical protein V1738_00680 [Patescibacteria group bacterium]
MKTPNMGEVDVAADQPDNSASFPALGDQLRRTISRFKDKPLTFLLLGGIAALLLFAFKLILAPIFSGEETLGAISLIDYAYRGFIGLVLLGLVALPMTALAFGAAYKIAGVDAIKHSLKRAMGAFMTGLVAFFTELLPSLLIVPGLIMSARFSLMLPAVVVEGKTGFDALSRSWNLANGYTKGVLRNMMLPLLLTALAVAATGMTIGLFAWPMFVALAFILPFAQILFQVTYEDLNRIKGATDPIENGYGVYRKLAVLGLILAIGVLAAGSLNVFKGGGQPTKVAQETTAPRTVSEPKTVTKNDAKTTDTKSGKDRDWQRYQDITALRLALNSYFSDTGRYPESLNELVPKYIESVPNDPVTGNRYHYARQEGTFSLGFSLEEGVAQLTAGGHNLTPSGFDALVNASGGTPTTTPVVPTTTPATTTPSTGTTPATTTGTTGTRSVDYGSGNTYNTYNSYYPGDPDTDSDGLSDQQEEDLGTDPLTSDSDNDGLIDTDEINIFGTDPNDADTDNDGASDSAEIAAGTNPLVSNTEVTPPPTTGGETTPPPTTTGGTTTVVDTDNDGLADTYEATIGTNPNDPDTDNDGLADGDEILVYGTNPLSADTDLDGVSDSQELLAGTNPLLPPSSSGGSSSGGTTYTGGGGGGGGGGSSNDDDEYNDIIEARIALFGLHEPTLSTLGFWHPAWPGL